MPCVEINQCIRRRWRVAPKFCFPHRFHRAPANDVGPRHVFYLGLVGQSAHAAQGATRGATNALLPELAGTLLRDLIVGVRYLGAASGSRHVGFADRVAKMRG